MTGKPKAFLSGFGEGFLGGVAGGGGIVGRFISHGVIGGAFNEIRGGKFGGGFLAAGFSAALGPIGPQGTWSGAAFRAAVGGTASVIGGGKFADGAVTAAFAYLSSRLSSRFATKSIIASDQLSDPDEGLEIFEEQLDRLRSEGVIPKQNWFMRTFFPNFNFVKGYGVLLPNGRVAVYKTIDGARGAIDRFGGSMVAGVTTGNSTRIFLSAAAGGQIAPIGAVNAAEMMRFVLLHEFGHQQRGGGCGTGASGEACADRYAEDRFGGE